MKVKVGDTIYDGSDVPIMVVLTDQDRENIRDMPPNYSKYAIIPDGSFEDRDAELEWMDEGMI